MGERDHDRDQPRDRTPPASRVTVRDAADLLGITVEAVRNRIKRGTLVSEKQDGTVYVLLDGDHARTDQPTGQPTAGRDRTSGQPTDQPQPDDRPAELVEELRDRIEYLERQVEEEREARRRADTLMARLMDRVPELSAASTPEPPGDRETPTQDEPRSDTPATNPNPQTGVQRRSWWRKFMGLE